MRVRQYQRQLIALSVFGALMAGCAHDPNKAEKIDTKMQDKGSVNGETVGIKDGDMVIQRKVLLTEELRDLQNDVYSLEDKVYGNEKYGSLGLYGMLKECRKKLSEKKNGGTGHLIWTEPIDRVTDKEDEFKIGVDERDKLVAVSEEYIKDRISRFEGYKSLLLKREQEYEDKVDICQAELDSRHYDVSHKDKNDDDGDGSQ